MEANFDVAKVFDGGADLGDEVGDAGTAEDDVVWSMG